MPGKPKHEHVGGDGIAQQGCRQASCFDEIDVILASSRRNGHFKLIGGEFHIRIARKISDDGFMGVDDHVGLARRNTGQGVASRRDDHVAPDNHVRTPRRQSDGVNIVWRRCDAQMADDRAAFLR